MSFRTWLARKLLPALPKVIEQPSPYEVERMTDLVRLAQAEGRSFAPIPVEWVASLLAERAAQYDWQDRIQKISDGLRKKYRRSDGSGPRTLAEATAAMKANADPVSRPFTFGTSQILRPPREHADGILVEHARACKRAAHMFAIMAVVLAPLACAAG